MDWEEAEVGGSREEAGRREGHGARWAGGLGNKMCFAKLGQSFSDPVCLQINAFEANHW